MSMEVERDAQPPVEGNTSVSNQVPAKTTDNRTLAQLNALVHDAPTLDHRMNAALEAIQKDNTVDQNAAAPPDDAAHPSTHTLKMNRILDIKRAVNMPFTKDEWAFVQAEADLASMSKEYNPQLTSSDFDCQMQGLGESRGHLLENLRTPCVISCGCANIGIMQCQFHAGGECTAAKPCKGRRVQTLLDMHTCLTKQLGQAQADLKIADIGRGLSTPAGMEQRVRAGVVCDSMDCKLASGVEDINRRAENNMKTEQAANQSNGNARYGSADDEMANLMLIRRLFVDETITEEVARSMILDTANWTYWVSYRQRTFITTAKAFADNQAVLGTKFSRDALQTMMDDFAHIPITYFNTIVADHVVSAHEDGFGDHRNRKWKSYFNDLFKIRAPEPITTLFTWLRVMLWKQMGCRVCPTTGELVDVVDANNPAMALYRDGASFHNAVKPILDGFSSNKCKLKQRCTEEGETQGTRSSHISVQMAAAKKSTKEAATKIAFERRMFGSMMSTIFRSEAAAPDVDTVVHKNGVNGPVYAPACCATFGANNVHVADRVTNGAKCLGLDRLFPDLVDFSSNALLTLFLEGGTHEGNTTIKDKSGQRGWRVTPSTIVQGEIETPQPHRTRFETDLPAYIASSAMCPEAVHGAPRPATNAGALFNESFVPKVGVPSGLGLLVHNPGPEHLSSKDQVHNLAIQLQSSERLVAHAAAIRAALVDGTGVVLKDPATQDNLHAEWQRSPGPLTYEDLVGDPERLTRLSMATEGMLLCHDLHGRTLRPDSKCPDRAPPAYPEALVDHLRAFVSAGKAWRAPLPQAVLNKAFRRDPVQGLKKASIEKARQHAVTNYTSVVNQGLLDPDTYSLDAYTELEYGHFLLTNEIARNGLKKTWRDSVLKRMPTRSVAEQQLLKEVLLRSPSPVTIDRIYLVNEDPLGDSKEFPTHHAWEVKCDQLRDIGALDDELPPQPLSFAYWLHRRGIDPVERFSTDEDMRMLHATQLYRVRIQALKVQSAKARESMPIKFAKDSDLRKKYVAKYKRAIQDQYDAGCKELDLVHKLALGRWLYQDQRDSDGGLKYPTDDAMRAIEDEFVLEMKGRFTGGYAHAIERQRNIKSGRLSTVYDGATRNAGDVEMEREAAAGLRSFLLDNGVDLAAIDDDEDQPDHMEVADVIATLKTGASIVGGTVVAPVDNGDVDADLPPPNVELVDDEEPDQMKDNARKDQLANGTLTIFCADLDYYADGDWKSAKYVNPRAPLFGLPKPNTRKRKADAAPS
jgi:hypothetical protein